MLEYWRKLQVRVIGPFASCEKQLHFPLRVCLSKFEAPQTIFIAIFELSGVENPYIQRIFIEFVIFEISKEYYPCVLNFLSNLVFVESYRLLDHDRYELTDTAKQRTEDMSRGPPIDFFLISRLNTLITPN